MKKLWPTLLLVAVFLPIIRDLIPIGGFPIEVHFIINLIPICAVTLWIFWLNFSVFKNPNPFLNIVVAICALAAWGAILYEQLESSLHIIRIDASFYTTLDLTFIITSAITLVITFIRAQKLFYERSKWFMVVELLLIPLAMYNWTNEILRMMPKTDNKRDDVLDDV